MPETNPSAPADDAPLQSPLPHSPTLDNEEPELANEEDVASDDTNAANTGKDA